MSSDALQSAPMRRGLLLVVASPSGAGKTTLCRRLTTEFPRLRFSVSCTTRPRRGAEVDGQDYRFVDEARFQEMVERAEFVEWAQVHGNRYGTPLQPVEEAVHTGSDLLFDIDWQGARALKRRYPEDATLVLVVPPTLEELERRLRQRGTDADEAVRRRLADAANEVARYAEYHHLVVNDDLNQAYDELRAIYIARRCRVDRRAAAVERLLGRPTAA